MKKYVSCNGYCPVLESDYSITITYLEYKTLRERAFIKDTFSCEYCDISMPCSSGNCPIYNSAPVEL